MSPGQVAGFGVTSANQDDAILWTQAGAVDLNPTNLSGYSNSFAVAAGGSQQAGYAYFNNLALHAMLWTGSPNTAIDLNPTNISNVVESHALATNGIQQVGDGYVSSGTGRHATVSIHAMLWNGTADSAVDLNPTNLSGITTSYAYGTDGTQQVGCGSSFSISWFNPDTALLWSGAANTAVDLNPTNLDGIGPCIAYGVGGSQQVGLGEIIAGNTKTNHALLWTGTAASAVDLNPTDLGITNTQALATNGIQQVGYGSTGALVWTDTAASAVQLQTFLPSIGNWTGSTANFIDPAGNVYGTASGTFDGVTGSFAVEWTPVPEPTMGSFLLIAATVSFARRRRNPHKVQSL